MLDTHDHANAMAKLNRHVLTRPVGLELVCVALALLCSAALLLGFNIFRLDRQMDAGRHADKIIEQLDKTTNHLLGIEVAVRGYALFGNPVLKKRYDFEAAKLSDALARLRDLASDTPGRIANLQRIRAAIGVRTEVVARVMQIAPDPPVNVALALHNAKTPGAIDAARQAILQMRAEEERRRDALVADVKRATVRDFTLAGSIALASVLTGVLGLSLALFGKGENTIRSNPASLSHQPSHP